jgi:hypothetical protein
MLTVEYLKGAYLLKTPAYYASNQVRKDLPQKNTLGYYA